jgi:hypothetical protein
MDKGNTIRAGQMLEPTGGSSDSIGNDDGWHFEQY